MVTTCIQLSKEEIRLFIEEAGLVEQAKLFDELVTFVGPNKLRIKKIVTIEAEFIIDEFNNLVIDLSRHSFLGLNLGIVRRKAGDIIIDILNLVADLIKKKTPFCPWVLKTDGNIHFAMDQGFRFEEISMNGGENPSIFLEIYNETL